MVQIKSLNSKSLAKVLGFMYLTLAVLFSPFFLIMMSMDGPGLTESILFLIILVLFYGIAGGIGGLLTSVVYNFVAEKFGGIEMELETA